MKIARPTWKHRRIRQVPEDTGAYRLNFNLYEMTFDIESSILNGEILEEYPDLGIGESCLVLGFSENIPIHAVVGWRGEKIAIITVYVPKPPKFIDPRTRRKK